MSNLLEDTVRQLINAIRDERLEVDNLVNQVDVILTDMSKMRADYPEHIAHGKKVAEAYTSDFLMDDEPEVELSLHPNAVWLSCWMLVTLNPETGEFS